MDQTSLKSSFNQFGLPQTMTKPQQQELDVECCDTKVWLWDGDQYEEFQSDYLNQIFPFKINKNTMVKGAKFIFHFLASSMHYWVELVEDKQQEKQQEKSQLPKIQQQQPQQSVNQQQKKQKLGIKDTKFLKNLFATDQSDNWIAFRRWGQQFMQKQRFQNEQQKQATFQPPKGGQIVHTYTRNGQQFVIIKYLGDNKDFSAFKQRFEVMFLFYIDGVSFVQQQVPTWVYYVVFKKLPQQKNNRHLFVGVLSEYEFKISAAKQRHRVSQVFILPNYQKYGHGKELVDLVYKKSLQNQKCFEITTQIPSFQYQCLRDYKELQMILDSKLIDATTIPVAKNAKEITQVRDKLLSKEILREIKTKLKLPGHQIQRLVHILIYEKILTSNDDMALAYFEEYLRQKIIFNRSPFKSRTKLPHITFYGESPQMKQFYLEKAKEDFLRNQQEIQQILTQSINGYKRVVDKLKKLNRL